MHQSVSRQNTMHPTIAKKSRSLQVTPAVSPQNCSTSSCRRGRNIVDNIIYGRHQSTSAFCTRQRLSSTTINSSRSLSKESGIVPGSVVNYSVTTSRTYTSLVPSVVTSNDGAHWISEHHETVTVCSELTCDLDLDLDLRTPSRVSVKSSDMDRQVAGLTRIAQETRSNKFQRRESNPVRSRCPPESRESFVQVPCRSHSDKSRPHTAAARWRMGVIRKSRPRTLTASHAELMTNRRSVVAVTKKHIVVDNQRNDAIRSVERTISSHSTRTPIRPPVPTRSSELRLALHAPVKCHGKRSMNEVGQGLLCVRSTSLSDKDHGHRQQPTIKKISQTQQRQRKQQHTGVEGVQRKQQQTGVKSVHMSSVGLKSRRKWGCPVALFKYAEDCDKSEVVGLFTDRFQIITSTIMAANDNYDIDCQHIIIKLVLFIESQ